ncbi:MAG: hypothetical protein B6244_12935 [Candidatus Cloacimonetes bacterium 4572_55]|nr:MAG: hypothetical protein B6244_12935 [Candidatus Cloacimonetes bacterium 4572_55]
MYPSYKQIKLIISKKSLIFIRTDRQFLLSISKEKYPVIKNSQIVAKSQLSSFFERLRKKNQILVNLFNGIALKPILLMLIQLILFNINRF